MCRLLYTQIGHFYVNSNAVYKCVDDQNKIIIIKSLSLSPAKVYTIQFMRNVQYIAVLYVYGSREGDGLFVIAV